MMAVQKFAHCSNAYEVIQRKGEQSVEKAFQLRSRIAQRFNVPKKVRLTFSLAAALPEALFEHSERKHAHSGGLMILGCRGSVV
jgi:hypothetical protein